MTPPVARSIFERLSTVVRLDAVQLVRSRAVTVGVVFLLLAGALAARHGHTVIERQRAALTEAPALQQEQHRAILDVLPHTAVAGDQAYYLRFFTSHHPSDWAPFSIGQRDVQAFNLKVRLLSIHGQLYDADLANPLLTAFGNFDIAFVLVFLLPLLIIAVTYDVWSAERELGTWDLVRAQPIAAWVPLATTLAVRFAAMSGTGLAVVGIAALWLALPLDWRLAATAPLTVAYVAVWFALAILVAALRRSSDFNLVALVSAWVALAVLGPALVTTVAAARYPTGESLEIAVRQRQGYHASWDRPVKETMAAFYERYPSWRSATVPEDRYSNAWYYGMQHRGDLDAEPAARRWRSQLAEREQWTSRALLLFPPALLQRALNALAGTDLESHLEYLDSVVSFHERLKTWFFPAVFDNRSIADMPWSAAPAHAHTASAQRATARSAVTGLVSVATLLLVAASILLRRALG